MLTVVYIKYLALLKLVRLGIVSNGYGQARHRQGRLGTG